MTARTCDELGVCNGRCGGICSAGARRPAPDAATRLADVLGIDWRNQQVARFTVEANGNEPPTVTVHHVVLGLEPQPQRFQLVPLDPPAPPLPAAPFDLDAACDAARARVRECIEDAYQRTRANVDCDLVELRDDMRARWNAAARALRCKRPELRSFVAMAQESRALADAAVRAVNRSAGAAAVRDSLRGTPAPVARGTFINPAKEELAARRDDVAAAAVPHGRYTRATDALAALSACNAAGSLPAAGAGLAVGLEGLTRGQIQQRLAAQGIEVTSDFAAQLQLDAVQQLEHGKALGVAHDEHAPPAIDGHDGAAHAPQCKGDRWHAGAVLAIAALLAYVDPQLDAPAAETAATPVSESDAAWLEADARRRCAGHAGDYVRTEDGGIQCPAQP